MRLVLTLVALALASCSHAPPDATPEGAVRTWVERMEAQVNDPTESKAAYDLLGPATKQNLQQRAERTSRIEGRHIEGYQVLAEGRFALRFRPSRFTTKIDGDQAIVEVIGADPSEHASIHCVKQSKPREIWRIELALPPPVEPQHRAE